MSNGFHLLSTTTTNGTVSQFFALRQEVLKNLLMAGTDLRLAVAIKPYPALRHFLRISLRIHQHGWRLISLIGARRELPVLTFPRPLGIEPSNPHAC